MVIIAGETTRRGGGVNAARSQTSPKTRFLVSVSHKIGGLTLYRGGGGVGNSFPGATGLKILAHGTSDEGKIPQRIYPWTLGKARTTDEKKNVVPHETRNGRDFEEKEGPGAIVAKVNLWRRWRIGQLPSNETCLLLSRFGTGSA